MSTPQLENGFTRLANELLDALLLAGLSSRQWSIVMAVVRKTYGFNKKSDEIGLGQLSAMTGIAKPHCSTTVAELISMKVLFCTGGTHAREIGLNKNYGEWVTKTVTQLPNREPVTETVMGGYQNGNSKGYRNGNNLVTESVTTKESIKEKRKTTPKDMSAGALGSRFEKFYSAYPKKRNRAQAEKAFASLNPDDSLLQTMLEAVEVAKRSRDDWRKDGGQFIPYAATWLNARGWEDEAGKVAYDAAELAVIDAYNAAMPEPWARAVAEPFSASRASEIRDFIGFQPGKQDMPKRYFEHCAENLAADPRFGFDWLIRRETYVRVREGAVKHKEAA